MGESREASSNSSRRRRWEVKSRELFDVAVEDSSSTGRKKSLQDIQESTVVGDNDELEESESEEKQTSPDMPVNPSAPPLSDEPSSSKEPRKKKKKISRKSISPVPPSNIVDHLNKLSEDIIEGLQPVNVPSKSVAGVMLGSGPTSTFNGNISTIYCEKLNNFVVGNDEPTLLSLYAKKKEQSKPNTRVSFALGMQKTIGAFSIFCQGLLSGIVVAHCIMVFVLAEKDVFQKSTVLTQVFHVLVSFLSSISLVAAFDRSDVVGQGALSGHGVKIPWTPLFYLSNCVISLVMIQGDDFYANFAVYGEHILAKSEDMFNWWRFMSAFRTFFVLLGWTSICRNPGHDALRNKLSSLIS